MDIRLNKHQSYPNKRDFSYLLILGAIIINLLGFSACQPEETPLHYGGQLYAEELFLQGMDFWSPYDLDIEHVLFTNPDDLVQAFLSGVVDIALFSDIQAVEIFNTLGEDALVIGVSERGDRINTLVRSDSEIKSWEDLHEKKAALRNGSGAELALKRYFAKHEELDWDAIEWVNIPVEDMTDALKSGAVDAITAIEPIPSIALDAGGTRILFTYRYCCPAPLVLVTTRDFAKKNPDKVIAFLQGQLDKTSLIESDPALAARTAFAQSQTYDLEIPAYAFLLVFKRLDFDLQVDESIADNLEDTARSMLDVGVIEEIPEFFIDNSYVEKASEILTDQ